MTDAMVEQVAVALAQRRVPQSTVYMDGSHNPTPMDYLTAEETVSVVRADERRRVLDEIDLCIHRHGLGVALLETLGSMREVLEDD